MSQQNPTDALATIGTVLPEGEWQRDAIHVAVMPVTAAERLFPGQRVGVLPDGTASISAGKKIGIVDPFLQKPVQPGERLWLCLFPRTITSLKHVWEHPDLPSPE